MSGPGSLLRILVVTLTLVLAALTALPMRGPLAQETQESREGQETEGGMRDPDGQEPRESVDPDSLGLAPSAIMTDEEEQALLLVEEILREQEVILAGQSFVYRSEGRRDPFRNILQLRRRELVAPVQRPPGLAGFLLSEVEVKATARFQDRWQAMLVGLDQRTYFAEVGADLYDGRIVEINDNEVVFEQEVEDMLGARSTRRVVKKLNPQSDG